MEVFGPLVVSPTKLYCNAPSKSCQKCIINLTNFSSKYILYYLKTPNDEFIEIEQTSGKLEPFNTIDLTVIVKPIETDTPVYQIELKWLAKEQPTKADWSEATVTSIDIGFHRSLKTQTDIDYPLMSTFATSDKYHRLTEIIDRRYQPVCNHCPIGYRTMTWKEYWLRQVLWVICILLLCGVAYNHSIRSTF